MADENYDYRERCDDHEEFDAHRPRIVAVIPKKINHILAISAQQHGDQQMIQMSSQSSIPRGERHRTNNAHDDNTFWQRKETTQRNYDKRSVQETEQTTNELRYCYDHLKAAHQLDDQNANEPNASIRSPCENLPHGCDQQRNTYNLNLAQDKVNGQLHSASQVCSEQPEHFLAEKDRSISLTKEHKRQQLTGRGVDRHGPHMQPANNEETYVQINRKDEKSEMRHVRTTGVSQSDQPILDAVKTKRNDESLQLTDEQRRQQLICREYGLKYSDLRHDQVGLIRQVKAKKNMAAVSPKSPKPAMSKTDKEESIWDKIGTLGRKKRIKEVQEVQEEGKHAIDSPGLPHFPTTTPEDYDLEENEERCMIDQTVYTNPLFIKLVNVLINWINDELASQRIIVQDLAEDLYDGQVLQKLLEKLTGDKLDVREVTQSEEGQKQKLHAVLGHFNQVLGLSMSGSKKWNVEAIHSKNIVSIMHLLVALARHFRPPVRLVEHVSVPVVIVKKVGGKLIHRTVTEVLTTYYDDVGMRLERDAIDSLFDHAPEQLQLVKKALVSFVNLHLTKINLDVTEIETQFEDGVYLTFLIGLMEGFFIPLHAFYPTPKDFEQKVHNVRFAFELMEEVGITKHVKARPEDIVNQDLKSTLRVLYILFMRYKNGAN